MKILTIFNTFGGGKQESELQLQGYIDGITSILSQKGVDQDVVLSSCLNTTACRNHLMDYFEDSIVYSFINEMQPLPVTVNLTAMKMETLKGPYDGFLYIDSGIRFTDENQIAQLCHIHKDYNGGMTHALTDTDTGIFEGLQIGRWIDDHEGLDKIFDGNGVYKIPIGMAVSLHCQIYDRSIFEMFGRIYVDCFAGHCSESVHSHICASLKKNYLLTNKVKVTHSIGLDGGSSGFSPGDWVRRGNSRFDQPYKIPSIKEAVKKGVQWGMGYQSWHPEGIPTDKSKFDENGFAIHDELKYHIKNNLFLNKNQLDYGMINHQLIQL